MHAGIGVECAALPFNLAFTLKHQTSIVLPLSPSNTKPQENHEESITDVGGNRMLGDFAFHDGGPVVVWAISSAV
jgi:hypothetical protein